MPRQTSRLLGPLRTTTVCGATVVRNSALDADDMSGDIVSIGALHTAPAYRKKGLAAIVVAQMTNEIRSAISANKLAIAALQDAFWVHAECEAYNVVAMKWFCSLGFEKVIDNTWTQIEFD